MSLYGSPSCGTCLPRFHAVEKSEYRILIGDDDQPSLRLIRRQLERAGFSRIETAATGDEVLARLSRENFDIAILDWVMPGKNGIAVLRECRAQERYADIAFAILSAEAHEHKINEARDAGAVAYIVKPATQQTLQEKMDNIVAWLAARRKPASLKEVR